MNMTFVRREWGAVTFVLTVIVGLVVVPLALYFNHTSPSAISVPTITTVSSARATSVHTPKPTPSPKHSPSPSPKKTP